MWKLKLIVDSRRAAFKINGTTYSSKLVDLPCIIESQKTIDNRHLFKVADISQMLVVEKPVRHGDESNITREPLNVDDYIWPHGITPPLRHVRKRRFRKRISRRAIEIVEEQVDELLKMDQESEHTQFGTSSSLFPLSFSGQIIPYFQLLSPLDSAFLDTRYVHPSYPILPSDPSYAFGRLRNFRTY